MFALYKDLYPSLKGLYQDVAMQVAQFTTEYRRLRAELGLFDANCWIGSFSQPAFATVAGLKETKEKLDRYEIRRAVLSHMMSKQYDPGAGNRMLIEAIRGHDEFFGAAVVIPGVSPLSEFLPYIEWLTANKIRLIRLFPKSHHFPLSGWYLQESLSVLEELHVPIVLWHTETEWDQVAELCGNYPDLDVVVEGTGQKLLYHSKAYYRLLERFPRFHLEIHNLVNYLGLDDIVRKFGSERLIFGTYFPLQDPNASTMLLTHGDLSSAEKENIAHRNLQRLIEKVGRR